MKTFAFTTTILASAAVASAQVTFDPTSNTFSCAIPNGAYCAGSSLESNIIIRCSNGVGTPGNCNDNLAGVPPVGVKTFAPCWQTSSVSGNAACSYNGVVYPDSGSPFSINGTTVPTSTGATDAPTSYPTANASSSGFSTGYAAPTGGATGTGSPTWGPSGTPQPTAFLGAAGKVAGSATLALIPVAAFFAFLI